MAAASGSGSGSSGAAATGAGAKTTAAASESRGSAAAAAAYGSRHVHEHHEHDPIFRFASRRSPVLATHGMVACAQPLASDVGIQVLRAGGNAADAAVAVAAALNVTEPTSTGIGGDVFALYFDAETKTVSALNASGRAPEALTLERALHDCVHGEPGPRASLPMFHAHTVTVPGAAAGWEDTLRKWGSMSLAEVLAPAIALAEEGFPVAPVTAYHWDRGVAQLRTGPHAEELLVDGKPPAAGQVFRNPHLASVFRDVAEKGSADGFYRGRVAEAIVEVLGGLGGAMSAEDLASHESTFVDPIHSNYKGVDVYEVPPNCQGVTALLALNILEGMDMGDKEHNRIEYLHTLIEAMRLAFADTQWFVTDGAHMGPETVDALLDKAYAETRRKLIDPSAATIDVEHGSPAMSSDTVSFSVVDAKGNSCSFIMSNYMGFGTGIIPKGCGFSLQNRGSNFVLNAAHPNCIGPRKRPYHTLMPAIALKGGELFASFSVMGGFMQPQGHTQVVLNMIDHGMNPQDALDAPRVCIEAPPDGTVAVEDGISDDTVAALKKMGHHVRVAKGHSRAVFGRGQIILRDTETRVLWGGSDGRADGCAMGY